MRYCFVSVILLFMTGCNKTTSSSIAYIPTPGETFTFVVPDPKMDSLTLTTVERFPKETYFGDPLYFVFYDENLTNETITHTTNRALLLNGSISSHTVSEAYSWRLEETSNVYVTSSVPVKRLLPGEKYRSSIHCFEFPPLEDWNDPFWKELRENMPPEGISCQVQLSYGHTPKDRSSGLYSSSVGRYRKDLVLDILIKPRPESEMALLEKWYKKTPKKLFPKVDGDRKVPHDMDLRASGRSNITVGWWAYNPWLFIRFGNRKPSDPNNPTTLEGWRKLEASLTPSTMRDEVRLTRLLLEFYSAKAGEDTENAKNELIEWLKSLPEVQRIVMTAFHVCIMYDFHRTSLRDKNRELMRAIYEMLDDGCKEAVCNFESWNYRDRSLTPPPGVTVMRSMEEVSEPTAEDLAHGTKELPDGFRIWNLIVNKKPVKQVGQFVELKESEDRIIVKRRDCTNSTWSFSNLTEEDQQYAREQSRKTTNEE